ncbi:hypothetical protein PMIN04_010819 [Paraphaeosphaeria minitans]
MNNGGVLNSLYHIVLKAKFDVLFRKFIAPGVQVYRHPLCTIAIQVLSGKKCTIFFNRGCMLSSHAFTTLFPGPAAIIVSPFFRLCITSSTNSSVVIIVESVISSCFSSESTVLDLSPTRICSFACWGTRQNPPCSADRLYSGTAGNGHDFSELM